MIYFSHAGACTIKLTSHNCHSPVVAAVELPVVEAGEVELAADCEWSVGAPPQSFS